LNFQSGDLSYNIYLNKSEKIRVFVFTADKKHILLTINPCSLLSSSAFNAEQLTVWYVSSLAAASNMLPLENNCSSLASNLMVWTNCLYPAYL